MQKRCKSRVSKVTRKYHCEEGHEMIAVIRRVEGRAWPPTFPDILGECRCGLDLILDGKKPDNAG